MASETNKKSVRTASEDIGERVAGAADDVSSSSAPDAETVKDHAGKAVDAAANLYSHGIDSARNALDELPANLSDASVAGERVVSLGRRRLHRGVREQPVEALLLAGAIGYLVGWATSRS